MGHLQSKPCIRTEGENTWVQNSVSILHPRKLLKNSPPMTLQNTMEYPNISTEHFWSRPVPCYIWVSFLKICGEKQLIMLSGWKTECWHVLYLKAQYLMRCCMGRSQTWIIYWNGAAKLGSVTISFSYAYHNQTDPTFSLQTLDVTMTSLWHHPPMTSFLHHYDLILLHYYVITRTL